MPSIFVWAATSPLSSSSSITQYIGSDWFLEDNGTTSVSYQYDSQQYDGETILWKAIKKPIDWVGSHVLEVQSVPYKRIKSDGFGTVEQVGHWIRCIIEIDTVDVKQVREWASSTEETLPHKKQMQQRPKHQKQSYHQYDTCLIRYDLPNPIVNC